MIFIINQILVPDTNSACEHTVPTGLVCLLFGAAGVKSSANVLVIIAEAALVSVMIIMLSRSLPAPLTVWH